MSEPHVDYYGNATATGRAICSATATADCRAMAEACGVGLVGRATAWLGSATARATGRGMATGRLTRMGIIPFARDYGIRSISAASSGSRWVAWVQGGTRSVGGKDERACAVRRVG